jgi:hypothetical protein
MHFQTCPNELPDEMFPFPFQWHENDKNDFAVSAGQFLGQVLSALPGEIIRTMQVCPMKLSCLK